jgi:hypothetical protein
MIGLIKKNITIFDINKIYNAVFHRFLVPCGAV